MSEDVSVGTTGARKRTVAILIALFAVAVLGAVNAAIAHSAPSDGDDAMPTASVPTPTPSVTATPAPAADPTDPRKLNEVQANDVIETALAAPFTTVGTADDLDALLTNVAVDSYAAELQAQWQELASQGWTISRTPVLVSTDVVNLDADAAPPTAEVIACVDSSAVTIADAEGDPVGDPSATLPRALHLFSLVQGDDDIWRISTHSFPNDPKC